MIDTDFGTRSPGRGARSILLPLPQFAHVLAYVSSPNRDGAIIIKKIKNKIYIALNVFKFM